jgi:lactoylglutathione lyase
VFSGAFPIITTPDMQRALGFYRDLLDAEVEFQFPLEGDPVYVGLNLGDAHLGIGLAPETVTGADGQRFALWVYADSCDAAVERLRVAHVTGTEEPADQPWGERLARVFDPDDNEVIIGQRLPDPAQDKRNQHSV